MPTKTSATIKRKDVPKVFDVAKPGKTAPPSSSKPVIVTNRPVLKDPMMVNDEAGSNPISTTGKKIQPLNNLGKEAVAEAEKEGDVFKVNVKTTSQLEVPRSIGVDAVPVAKPAEAEAVKPSDQTLSAEEAKPQTTPSAATAETTPSTVADEKKDEPAATPPASGASETPASDSLPEESPAGEKSDQQKSVEADRVAKEAQEHVERIDKLVESREYVLPINASGKRRVHRHVALGLLVIVILVAAWADVALDAGLVHIGNIKPITHLFND